MEIQVIRSNRSTMAIELRPSIAIMRVPMEAGEDEVRAFLKKHEGWVRKHAVLMQQRLQEEEEARRLTPEELRELAEKAKKLIPERVAYYAPMVGVTYGRITIRSQRTKWGSCSGKHNLNFNCLLMLAPPQVLDSVVVHELCHLKEMNHSARFYAEVERVYPSYRKWERWLKQKGHVLMRMLPEKG